MENKQNKTFYQPQDRMDKIDEKIIILSKG